MRRAAAAAALALACARALHEPGPLEAPGAPVPPGASAAALLAEARRDWARRPDREAVRRAEALYLAAAQADPAGADGPHGAVLAKVWLIEHEPDRAARAALAGSAVDAGQWCLRRAPESASCHYALALALGVQARERHATAKEGLDLMADHLRRAAASDPGLDQGGPERVLALLLLRAPGWPLGPGDPETGLAEARKAVARSPDFPPNRLALAEGLLATGADGEGRAEARRALDLARARAASGEPDAPDWVRDGERILRGAASPAPAP